MWEQNLFALELPAATFDGVFAHAVLFHVPSAVLPREQQPWRASVWRAASPTSEAGPVDDGAQRLRVR